MEIIKAHSKGNAVKVIAFAIYFSQKLSTEDMEKLIKQTKEINFFNEEFNNFNTQDEIAVTFNPDGIPTQTQTLSGVVYDKQLDDQISEWSLIINKEFIVVTYRKYTRWNDISLKAYTCIKEAFNLISNDKNIKHLTLEYLDEFEILNDNTNWKKELFKKSNRYIPSNIYKLDDFWHTNQGYFITLKHLKEKLLDTININYFSDEIDNFKNKVNIRTQHMLSYDNSYSSENIKERFDIIHRHSKDIFEEIIHDNILKKFDRGES